MVVWAPPPPLWTPPKPAIIRSGDPAGPYLASLMVNQLAGFGAGEGFPNTLLGIVQSVGLTSGLLVCLDAGDLASYDGSSQTWVNTAPGGVGTSFYRGTGSGSDGADPTFNGVAGALSEAEYFSLDGADYFTEVTAAWGDDEFHKNNAAFTIAVITRTPEVSVFPNFFGNCNGGAGAGIEWYLNRDASDRMEFLIRNDAGTPIATIVGSATTSPPNDTPAFNGLSVDEALGAGGVIFRSNAASETATSTYASPGTGSAQIAATFANGRSGPLESGSRMYGGLVWNRPLSNAEFTLLYDKVKLLRFPSMA